MHILSRQRNRKKILCYSSRYALYNHNNINPTQLMYTVLRTPCYMF